MQSRYDGSDPECVAKGVKTYSLKMQSGYGGSDPERHGRGREGILAENV
jgi:hypothetical protein